MPFFNVTIHEYRAATATVEASDRREARRRVWDYNLNWDDGECTYDVTEAETPRGNEVV